MTDTTDTTAYRFRTAIGGFHKGDVAEYIAKISREFGEEAQQKDRRIEALQQENLSLREQLNILMAASPILEEIPAPAEPEAEAAPPVTELELEAYRRAEATERLANQRAKKLYMDMESICHNADAEFEAARAVADETAQAVLKQAQVLDEACKKLTAALHSSRQELSALDAMLPDPSETTEA